MSLTGRIRLFLVVIALLPPLLMMTVIYYYSARQQELTYGRNATEDLRQAVKYREQFRRRLYRSLEAALESNWFYRTEHAVASGRPGQVTLDARQFDLDFLELLDRDRRVLASYHRPGLVGETILTGDASDSSSIIMLREKVEYDLNGPHAALAGLTGGDHTIRLYGGWYLAERFQTVIDQIVRGETKIVPVDDADREQHRYAGMEFGALYQPAEKYEAILSGGEETGFYLIATFDPTDSSPVFASFLNVIGLVALASVLTAVGLGIYISGKAKREIDNLVDAFTRVAGGDLNTTVMAYEEGEFAELADGFSEMVYKLRQSQRKLATSEKIAAWQMMARKIAHEIKNPLTPIGISADDLRRSYREKLPRFDETVERNTRMINDEIKRLSTLLDQFVGFARMSPPVIAQIPTEQIAEDIEAVYADKVASGALHVNLQTTRRTIRVDREQIKQVLLNLTKNGFEAADDVKVRITIADSDRGLRIAVEDSGPGFSEATLKHGFQPYVSSKTGGSGLGLVICQRIIHDHGGSIELYNRSEGGAGVALLLPQD